MRIRQHGIAAACCAVAALGACRPAAQAPANAAGAGEEFAATMGAGQLAPHIVDSQAVQILRRSMDYLNGLERFAVTTQILTEDQLDTGNRVDYESRGSVTVERPNKVRGERHGVGFQQTLFFDGTTLTLYDAARRVYASKPAPGTIPGMFQLAYDSLGLSVPISDLIWPDVFPMLVQNVTLARVMDKEIIGGVTCDHLVFSRPDVDFQIWIPDTGDPLPMKYIVTDPATPALLSIVTTLSDWKVNQRVPPPCSRSCPRRGRSPFRS